MSDVIPIDRRDIAATVRLYDRGHNFVCVLDADEVRELLREGEVEPAGAGVRGRIRAVRWVTPPHKEEAAPAPPGGAFVIRRRGYGDSHCRETPNNPRGVWTIDRVMDRHRRMFRRVLEDCLLRRAA